MAERRISPWLVGGIAAGVTGAIAATVAVLALAKPEIPTPPGEGIQLYEGENVLIYPGPHQSNKDAFSSIRQYLMFAYRLETSDGMEYWVAIDPDSDRTLMTGVTLGLIMSQACLWTF